MSDSTKEIASGAVREIEPELRELFTEVVERDPREVVKMLEPYPHEFVVQMLELLNPASALNILDRFDPPRRQTVLATASVEDTRQWVRNQTYPERTIALCTFGSTAKRIRSAEYPWAPSPEERLETFAQVERQWTSGLDWDDMALDDPVALDPRRWAAA